MTVLDLGCGTGELTARLAGMLPDSNVLGVDSSPEMLARAAAHARDRLRFEAGHIEAVHGAWDLVFSHAAIQWLDDHEALVPRLLSLVRPGGQLAVQLPSNHDHFTHRIIQTLAAEDFADDLGGWTRQSPVLPVERYAELLHAAGGTRLTVLTRVYCHLLPGADEMVEWTKGTTLVPYLERLAPPRQEAFLEEYRRRVRAAVGPTRGEVLYPFRRILFAATRPAEACR